MLRRRVAVDMNIQLSQAVEIFQWSGVHTLSAVRETANLQAHAIDRLEQTTVKSLPAASSPIGCPGRFRVYWGQSLVVLGGSGDLVSR